MSKLFCINISLSLMGLVKTIIKLIRIVIIIKNKTTITIDIK
jgi:hypothetical protein